MRPGASSGDFFPDVDQDAIEHAVGLLGAHLQHSPLGAIHWDERFRITLWSPQSEALFGWGAGEVTGKTMLEVPLVHHDDADRAVEACRQIFVGEVDRKQLVHRTVTKDGRTLHCRWTYARVALASRFAILTLVEDVSDYERTNARLREVEQSFRALFDHNPKGVCSLDLHGRILTANKAALDLMQISAEDLPNVNFQRFVPREELPRAYALFSDLFAGRGASFEMDVVRTGGEIVPIAVTTMPVIIDGKVAGAFSVSEDISERRANERAVWEQRDQIRKLCVVATMPAQEPEKHVDAALRLGLELFGLDVAAVYRIDRGQAQLAFTVVSNAGGSLSVPETLIHAAAHDVMSADSLPHANGVAEPRSFIGAPIDVDSLHYGVLAFAGTRERAVRYTDLDRDIVSLMASLVGSAIERAQSHERLNRLAFTDPLTLLPNRTLFIDRLTQALSAARRNGERLAVVYLDLDHFKDTNDSLGHAIGDCLLQAVGERLRSCLRASDTVARMGGDEFIMLLPTIGDRADAVLLAEKILETLEQPFYFGEHEQFTTASIGVSLFPDDGRDAQTLIKNADIAMYRAKDRGRNAYTFFTPEFDAQVASRVAFETRLRRAVARDEFVIHYQPIIDLADGRLVSVEALMRWQDPEHGLIAPDRFIGSLEQTGLIVSVGMSVLRTASRQVRQWHDQGFPGLRLAVNLSARQLHNPNLVTQISNVLAESGLDPRYLDLEITETVAMSDATLSIEVLRSLKMLGVSLSVDDFGTGYSSLSYLLRFPLDKLKIDRSFIGEVHQGRDEATIVSTIVGMAHSLHLSVTAEGVESEEQLEFLRELECDEVQGYFFSRALPADEFSQKGRAWLNLR